MVLSLPAEGRVRRRARRPQSVRCTKVKEFRVVEYHGVRNRSLTLRLCVCEASHPRRDKTRVIIGLMSGFHESSVSKPSKLSQLFETQRRQIRQIIETD